MCTGVNSMMCTGVNSKLFTPVNSDVIGLYTGVNSIMIESLLFRRNPARRKALKPGFVALIAQVGS